MSSDLLTGGTMSVVAVEATFEMIYQSLGI